MARRSLAVVTVLLVAGLLAKPVSAADHVVAGTQLTVGKQGSRGSLTLVLRDPSIPIPAPRSADDPPQGGMVVTLFGRVSSEQAALVAAPGLGRPGWKVCVLLGATAAALPGRLSGRLDLHPDAPARRAHLSAAHLRRQPGRAGV